MPRVIGLAALVLVSLLSKRLDAAPASGAELVKARQFFFGAENVEARTGVVDRDEVIFTWLTNSSIGVSSRCALSRNVGCAAKQRSRRSATDIMQVPALAVHPQVAWRP